MRSKRCARDRTVAANRHPAFGDYGLGLVTSALKLLGFSSWEITKSSTTRIDGPRRKHSTYLRDLEWTAEPC